MNRLALSVMLIASLLTGTAMTSEITPELAPELNGAWKTPDAGWDGRALILLHGFADDRDGAGDLMKKLAGELAEAGVASLRINFRGEGDRTRTRILSTFDTRLEDTAVATDFILRQRGIDPRRIGLMGWSLGGATAIEAAARRPGMFKAMVLWSSVSGNLHQGFTSGAFADPASQAAREGTGTLVIPGWKTVTLRHEFFESFKGFDTDTALARFSGAFLSIRGTDDYLPAHESIFLKVATGRPREAILIGGADHIFNVFQPELGHADRVTRLTTDWVRRVL